MEELAHDAAAGGDGVGAVGVRILRLTRRLLSAAWRRTVVVMAILLRAMRI